MPSNADNPADPKNSVIVAHPLQQHSYRLAAALKKENLLLYYCTTVYYRQQKSVYKILNKLLGENNIRKMKSRRSPVLGDGVKQYNEFLGLLFLFGIRVFKKNVMIPRLYRLLICCFGKNIAKLAIRQNAKAVVMYDTTACYCFRALQKHPEIIKIVDMSSAASPYIIKLIKRDKSAGGAFAQTYTDKLKSFSLRYLKIYEEELRLADCFLVASNFVEKSLLDCGIPKEKIYHAPYGADVGRFRPIEPKTVSTKITFLFSGRLEAAKGIYYLLEAFKQLGRNDVQLLLAGSMCGQESLFEEYKEYFTYLGVKVPADMPVVYQNADVFVFPSLYDGFGLAVMEAMASGMPALISENSGVDDIITEGREGFVVPCMDTEALKKKIVWFCENRDQIEKMGQAARRLSTEYTWDNYETNVTNAIEDILNKRLEII